MAQNIGCAVRREASVDSTNRQARLWARSSAPHGAVVIAGEQTAGRGRRGRTWTSPPGSGLWFSAILRPNIDLERLPLLTFAAALATADACHAVTGADIAIKWPNDLLLSGRKICGILLEREVDAIIVGIGINVRQRAEDFPPELRERAGSLEMLTGKPVDMARLEAELMAQLTRRVDGLDFMGEYARRCVTLGQRVRVLEAEAAFEGIAEALDDAGALLVRDDAGTLRRVLAADVSIRGLAGYT